MARPRQRPMPQRVQGAAAAATPLLWCPPQPVPGFVRFCPPPSRAGPAPRRPTRAGAFFWVSKKSRAAAPAPHGHGRACPVLSCCIALRPDARLTYSHGAFVWVLKNSGCDAPHGPGRSGTGGGNATPFRVAYAARHASPAVAPAPAGRLVGCGRDRGACSRSAGRPAVVEGRPLGSPLPRPGFAVFAHPIKRGGSSRRRPAIAPGRWWRPVR